MIEIFHGSTSIIKHPNVDCGRNNLDFGKAFYTTRVREQAEQWARVVCSRNEVNAPVLNVYRLDIEAAGRDGYKLLTFESYDIAWLNFIVGSRRGQKPWLGYDIIEGGVANDRIIDTVEGYMNGDFDADVAIWRLKYNKPNNQIAILSQEVVDKYLVWVDSVTLEGENE